MMQNWHRWVLAILVGFFFGAVSALTDSTAPTVLDIVRHGSIGVLPTLGALQMTLKKGLGIGQ